MTKSPRSPWRRFALAFRVAPALIPATASGVTGPLDTVAAMQPSWNPGNTYSVTKSGESITGSRTA